MRRVKNFINQQLDITVGAASATLIGMLLRSYNLEIPADLEVSICLLVVAMLARLGIKLKTKPVAELEPDITEVDTLLLPRSDYNDAEYIDASEEPHDA